MMRILVLIIGLFVCFVSHGQYIKNKGDSAYEKFKAKAKYQIGFVTMLDSTRVIGVLKRTTSNLADGDLKLVTRSGEKKSFYAKEILSYQVGAEKYMSYTGELYKVEIDGVEISLYSQIATNYYTTVGSSGSVMTHSTSYKVYYVKKENETILTLVPSKKRKFKAFASYFSGCKQVHNLIMSGDLKSDEMRIVVLKYNSCKN